MWRYHRLGGLGTLKLTSRLDFLIWSLLAEWVSRRSGRPIRVTGMEGEEIPSDGSTSNVSASDLTYRCRAFETEERHDVLRKNSTLSNSMCFVKVTKAYSGSRRALSALSTLVFWGSVPTE